MQRYQKIVDINPDSQVELPIAAFPPFKLRSSMCDKDPVIWVHLIEVYIHYIQTLIHCPIQLTAKSREQLTVFVKTYLYEIASEEGKILSLGSINVQITKNLEILKVWVLELIKYYGIIELKMDGESLWNFAKIYCKVDSNLVRSIIIGNYKSVINSTTINSTNILQKTLINLITNSKFNNYDLEIFAILLQSSVFTDKFITNLWIENLEKLYSNGDGIFADIVKKLMVLSLVNCSIKKVADLTTKLNITSKYSLKLFPLFSGIITSESFQKVNPGLFKKLPFLNSKTTTTTKHAKTPEIETLQDLFPSLTISKAKKLLQKHTSVEAVTSLLLESPELLDEIEVKESRHINTTKLPKVINKPKKSGNASASASHVPDELKNKTMAFVLRQMYESDEDEHDDTYDDADASAGNTNSTSFSKIEVKLFEQYIKDPALFDRTSRKTPHRQTLKQETKWSDEQIEGWARMLQKNPKRVQLFMDSVIYNNKPQPSTTTEDSSQKTGQSDNQQPVKRTYARNEKNKASKANHNRKRGHDKKLARAAPSS